MSRFVRQLDIVEFLCAQKCGIKAVSLFHRQQEKGCVAYLKDAVEFVRDLRKTEKKDDTTKKTTDDPLTQYYGSQDLLKKMKWKRVTWDENADFDGFSKRILDNDNLFGHIPAFSYMSLHITHDPRCCIVERKAAATELKAGSLTEWLLKEREMVPLKPYVPSLAVRQPPFVVDWTSGEAKVLDTASPQELMAFLKATAPRLMALQQKLEKEQSALVDDVEKARLRVGVYSIKFNKSDKTAWDDADRKSSSYVTPRHLKMFTDALLSSAFLYRLYLKGTVLRVAVPGTPYYIDSKANEIVIPADFADYQYLSVHPRYQTLETLFNFARRLWWLWYTLAMMLVGDLEFI